MAENRHGLSGIATEIELLVQVAKHLLPAVQLASVFSLSLVPWQSSKERGNPNY